jgi:hypothetical protein
MSVQDAEAQSDATCEDIDGKFSFIMGIFRWKYNRGYNPLRDSEQDWMSKLKDPGAIQFARDVSILVRENSTCRSFRVEEIIANEKFSQPITSTDGSVSKSAPKTKHNIPHAL